MAEDPSHVNTWQPISLSAKARKRMDRVGGAELILPWPEGLPRGRPVALDETRDATPEEHAAAEQIVGPACREHGLVPVTSSVTTMKRPPGPGFERSYEVDQHLAVLIIGKRWVGAKRVPLPSFTWHPAGKIPRLP